MLAWVSPPLYYYSDNGFSFPLAFPNTGLSMPFAVEAILVFATVLYSAQPFKYTGPLVATVQAVLVDIIPFLALGLIVLVGFSIGAFALDESRTPALLRTMQNLFYSLLGDFNRFTGGDQFVGEARPEVFYGGVDGFNITLEPSETDETLAQEIVTHGFLDIFILLEGIVLLTLLYAIMNDTHDKVKMNAKAHLTRSRATVVSECEAIFCKWLRTRMERKTKKYLYVLKPVEKMSFVFGYNWQGKLKRTEKMMKRLLQDTKDELQSDLDELKMKFSRLEGLETKLEMLIQKLQLHDHADS